jgi:Ca2+:H+ antiporter
MATSLLLSSAPDDFKPAEPPVQATESPPAILGIRPIAPREPFIPIEEPITHGYVTVANVIWSVFIGSWLSLLYAITGLLFCLTVYGYRHGLYCFDIAGFLLYPFGKYIAVMEAPRGPENFVTKILWILFFPIWGFGLLIGCGLSWETVYFIPMAKHLKNILLLSFENRPTGLTVRDLQNSNPQRGFPPAILLYSSGSSIYFKYSVMSFEVVYLNFFPFAVLAFLSLIEGTPLDGDLFGSIMGILGALPCAYLIGICVDELSHKLGVVLGAILNSIFLTLVELILYVLSLLKNMIDVVRSAVTGAFLMNLLVIPGFGMLAAGLKWHDVRLNKKSQSISGTFLLLSVMSVLFPSIFYHTHEHNTFDCNACNLTLGPVSASIMNCTMCMQGEYQNLESDSIYTKMGIPLMVVMTAMMPIIYVIGVVFSLKTHAAIFEPPPDTPHEAGPGGEMTKSFALVVLIGSTLVFSGMAHVITDKIPGVIESLHLSQRFVGLVFYTLIPNAAEYMNAIKFALNGNIGLSMEIGNQGAILTALIEMPALVLVSYIVHLLSDSQMFTLIFPLIDVFCVMIAVLLRNSILTDKEVNYFTGLSFLVIFALIAVVYFFEQ